jgi:hypothetical protein
MNTTTNTPATKFRYELVIGIKANMFDLHGAGCTHSRRAGTWDRYGNVSAVSAERAIEIAMESLPDYQASNFRIMGCCAKAPVKK